MKPFVASQTYSRNRALSLREQFVGGLGESTGASVVKDVPASAGDVGSSPGLGRSPGEGTSNPLQSSCLDDSMDRRAGGLHSMELKRVGHNLATKKTTKLGRI